MGQHRDAEMIARLRVATHTGALPADVGAWALGRLERDRRQAERQLERDELLLRGADQLGGSRWQRANRLADLIEQCRGQPPLDAPTFSVTWYVQAALLVDPCTPGSVRHLLRLVQ